MKTGVIFRKAGLMIWLLIFLSVMGHAQTILYTEDFEGASPDWSLNTTDLGSIGVQGQSNQWLINNTYTGGTWLLLGMIPITVVNTPNQPAPVTNSPTSKYLHINYPASGIYNACYVDNTVTLNGGVVGTNFAKMNSDISTVGQTGVTLEFYWLGHGAVGKLYYSTNNGTTWTQVGGSFAGQGTWTLASITNIAFDNQASLRFGYLFDNSVAGTGLDPAFSIDQIKLYAPSAGTPPVANFSSSDTTICVGSCINFTDMSTNTPTSWAWTFAGAATASSGAQNPSGICYNVVGDYTVELTATNASGSDVETKTSFIHVVALPSVTASATVNPICAGQNTDISAGGATSYVWDQGLGSGSGFTVAPGSSTTYSVTGTDANGCVNTAQVIINVNSLPTIDITGTSPICIGDNSILSGTGGTGYNWSTLESTDSILVSPATTTTYTVTGTDGTCSNTASFQVVVNTVPVASIAGPTSVCAGGTVTLTATGGVGVYNFDWSTLEVTADIDVSPSANTTYYVTVSAGTCSDSASHTVTVSPLPVIGIAGTASICAGDNSILTASGGTGYTWSTTQTINPITVNPTTTTTYTVTGTDGTCSNTSSFDVVVNPLPSIGISGISAICEGDNTTLSGTGGTSYEWSTLETTNSIVVAPLSTQTYTVTGTDGTCSNTSSTTVTVNSVPVAAITGDTIVCAGDVTILTASGGTGYLWSNAATSTSVSVSPSVNQYYYVTVSNGPCSDVDSVFVTVNPLPVADAGNDTTIYLGTSVNLLGTGGLLYSWTPPDGLSCTDCSNPVATPDQTTLYTLVVTDANGCSSSDDVLITVEYNCGDVFVPTAFSPNADGYNDVFVVRGNCIETITFKIFDRWGEKVYETTIPGEGWDGEFQGQPVNGGVYSYYYSGTLITGDIITGKGNVTLIR